MPLFGDAGLNKLRDLGAEGMRALNSGEANRAVLQHVIDELTQGPVAPKGDGTLYLPPGRYRIGLDRRELSSAPGDTLSARWQTDLVSLRRREPTPATASRVEAIRQGRLSNPFGASVLVPPGLTLWLQSGAILAPERGCIIDLQGALIAESTQLFDLSEGGLVTFGDLIPIVRPEWWGLEGADQAAAIQYALRAAIDNRSIQWDLPVEVVQPDRSVTYAPQPQTLNRAPLGVELRGVYQVGRTLEVHGNTARNDLAVIHNPSGSPAGVRSLPNDTTALIAGAWGGRSRQGATLRATSALGARAILHLYFTPGLTVRNIGFDVMAIAETRQRCVEIWTTSVRGATGSPSAQMISFQGCRFDGAGKTLVQVGEAAVIDPSFPLRDESGPRVNVTFRASDFSLLAFDECEFHPEGGLALDCQANQTFPIRYRDCQFVGAADAMLSLWSATHFIDGCYFENRAVPMPPALAAPGSYRRGYEQPYGVDVFLRNDLPTDERPVEYDLLPGLTAVNCVSRSDIFLATVSPNLRELQQHEWPVVLVNLRHHPRRTTSSPSVVWGLQNHTSALITNRALEVQRMGRGAPLVVIGGRFAQPIEILRGAVQSAVIGARAPGGVSPWVLDEHSVDSTDVPGARVALPATYVFGLQADQPSSFRP